VRDLAGDASPPFSFDFYILKGDLNGDGTVSIADFITLSSNFGKSPASYSDGDVNYDHAVTISDFIDLAANFNKSIADFAAIASPQPALSSSTESLSTIERSRHESGTRRHHRRPRLRAAPSPLLFRIRD
jgi:hypothetical protein